MYDSRTCNLKKGKAYTIRMKITAHLISLFFVFSSLCAEEPMLQLSFEFLNSLDLSFRKNDDLHRLIPYHGREIEIKGFLYRSEIEGWVLSSEPNLKSCCIGSPSKSARQIFLDGDLVLDQVNSIETIQGLFIVEPIKDEKGEIKRLFKIVHPKILPSSHKLSLLTLIGGCILFLIVLLTINRIGKLLRDRLKKEF